jgi:acetyl esterase/lipase
MIAGVIQAQDVTPVTLPELSSDDPMPERILTFANGVSVSTDVVYSTLVGYRPITLDLYHLEEDGPRPLVIYIHGGAWMIGHKRQSGRAFEDFPAVLTELASRGYVVASIDYRLANEAPFPAAINDVRTAIRFLKANANRYGIDTLNVAIWGNSAGAQLAALAALDCGHSPGGEDKHNAGESDCVQAAVAWYGVYDFATLPQTVVPRAVNAYLDCVKDTCSPERINAASAAAHVDSKDPPVLLMHGTDDTTVPITQSQELEAKLKAAKVPVTLEVIPDVGHSWVGTDAAATQAAGQRALDLTFRFFDKELKKER